MIKRFINFSHEKTIKPINQYYFDAKIGKFVPRSHRLSTFLAICFLSAGLTFTPEPDNLAVASMDRPIITDYSMAGYTPSKQEIAALFIQRQYKISKDIAKEISEAVFQNAAELKQDPNLLLGIIRVESGFKQNEVSTAGAMGLMQVIPSYHTSLILEAKQKFGLDTNLFSPKVNIWIGSRIKQAFLDRSGGKLDLALLGYNGSSKDPQKTYYHQVLAAKQVFDKELKWK